MPILRTLLACLSVAQLSLCALTPVNYGAFTQTATYSLANQLDVFTANGLNVTYLQIPNSTYGYAQLLSGGYDILTGTADNAVSLRFNQNKTVTILGELDGGPDLAIASVPGITEVTQLRGKALMVDSATSGYAYVLRKVLGLYGLKLEDGDYTFQVSSRVGSLTGRCAKLIVPAIQVVGSTNIRYQYLTAGSLPNGTAVYATILTYPFTAEAEAQTPPLNILARVSDFVNPFASSAFTVSQDSLTNSTKKDVYTRFLASFLQANKLLADPTKSKCAIAAIAKHLNVTTAVAKAEYAAATAKDTGETVTNGTFAVNRQGLLNVIDVRGQFGGFAAAPADFNYAEAIVPGTGMLIDDGVRLAAAAVKSSFKPKC